MRLIEEGSGGKGFLETEEHVGHALLTVTVVQSSAGSDFETGGEACTIDLTRSQVLALRDALSAWLDAGA